MPALHKKVLDNIIFLYEGYSREHRATTQPFHYEKVRALVKDYVYAYDDLLVREPLIEHSGSLPIIATAVYPYIDNANVDLGRALIMLAIHDIGEIISGDEITFTKKKESAKKEQEHALSLLPKSFHKIYLEMEERTSETAHFAKAIDKMTPDIVDFLTPAEITIERYRKFTKKEPEEVVSMIKDFKHPYMTWNPFVAQLHLEILERMDKKLKPFYN